MFHSPQSNTASWRQSMKILAQAGSFTSKPSWSLTRAKIRMVCVIAIISVFTELPRELLPGCCSPIQTVLQNLRDSIFADKNSEGAKTDFSSRSVSVRANHWAVSGFILSCLDLGISRSVLRTPWGAALHLCFLPRVLWRCSFSFLLSLWGYLKS